MIPKCCSVFLSLLLAAIVDWTSGQLILPTGNNILTNTGFNGNNQPYYVPGYPYSTLYGQGNGLNNGLNTGGYCNGVSGTSFAPRQCWPTSPSRNQCSSSESCTYSRNYRNFYCCRGSGLYNVVNSGGYGTNNLGNYGTQPYGTVNNVGYGNTGYSGYRPSGTYQTYGRYGNVNSGVFGNYGKK